MMNEPPEPYSVSYSGRVLDSFRALIRRARGTKAEPMLRLAVQDLDHRLRIYPQFGEPLYDLSAGRAQLWIGTLPPLVVHYILDQDRRQVIVVKPPMLLPNSGVDPQK